MATTLKRMKIREISGVDLPASPGADVILMKRFERDSAALFPVDFVKYNADEPRDAHGRWSTTLGSYASKVYRAIKRGFVATGRGGKAVTGTRVAGANPVRGGGVQVTFHTPLGGPSKLRAVTHVQLRPEHLNAQRIKPEAAGVFPRNAALPGAAAQHNSILSRLGDALNTVHDALGAYARPTVEPIKGFFGGHVEPEPEPSSETKPAVPGTIPFPAKVFSGDEAVKNSTLTTAQRPPSATDQLMSQQWMKNPDNDLPINVVRGLRLADNGKILLGGDVGTPIPLNHPTFNYETSNGHAYVSTGGNYIPGGTPVEQKWTEENSDNVPAWAALPISTASKAGGSGYRPEGAESGVVPPLSVVRGGTQARQQILEGRILGSDINMGALSTAAHPRYSKRLFSPVPKLFSEPEFHLFDKAFNASQARDQIGRWAAALATSVKSAHPADLVGHATDAVVGSHFLPGGEGAGLGDHVAAAVRFATARVQSDPLVQAAAKKLVAHGRLLFRKTGNGDQRGELILTVNRALSKLSFPADVAGNQEAMSAVRKMVLANLTRSIRLGSTAR